jgi:hypothetical protein
MLNYLKFTFFYNSKIFIIFLTVRCRNKSYYYFGYIATFWIPTILFPCLCFIEVVHDAQMGFCAFRSKIGTGIRVANWFLLFSVQVILSTSPFDKFDNFHNFYNFNEFNNFYEFDNFDEIFNLDESNELDIKKHASKS